MTRCTTTPAPLSFPPWVVTRAARAPAGGRRTRRSRGRRSSAAHPALARAGARFLASAGLDAAAGRAARRGLPRGADARRLARAARGLRAPLPRADPSPAAAARYEAVGAALRELGFTLTRRGIRRGASDVDRLLTTSAAKSIALVEVVGCEYDARGERLRALVLDGRGAGAGGARTRRCAACSAGRRDGAGGRPRARGRRSHGAAAAAARLGPRAALRAAPTPRRCSRPRRRAPARVGGGSEPTTAASCGWPRRAPTGGRGSGSRSRPRLRGGRDEGARRDARAARRGLGRAVRQLPRRPQRRDDRGLGDADARPVAAARPGRPGEDRLELGHRLRRARARARRRRLRAVRAQAPAPVRALRGRRDRGGAVARPPRARPVRAAAGRALRRDQPRRWRAGPREHERARERWGIGEPYARRGAGDARRPAAARQHEQPRAAAAVEAPPAYPLDQRLPFERRGRRSRRGSRGGRARGRLRSRSPASPPSPPRSAGRLRDSRASSGSSRRRCRSTSLAHAVCDAYVALGELAPEAAASLSIEPRASGYLRCLAASRRRRRRASASPPRSTRRGRRPTSRATSSRASFPGTEARAPLLLRTRASARRSSAAGSPCLLISAGTKERAEAFARRLATLARAERARLHAAHRSGQGRARCGRGAGARLRGTHAPRLVVAAGAK